VLERPTILSRHISSPPIKQGLQENENVYWVGNSKCILEQLLPVPRELEYLIFKERFQIQIGWS
jgi:hypothetical protein